jgi:hypothetical protein
VIEARALFLVDGTSDRGLGDHVRALARPHGVRLLVTTPEFEWMSPPPGRKVHERLRCILRSDPDFDVLLVHRDAEAQSPGKRLQEIAAGMGNAGVSWPCVPIVPVRMTEAWLLLDETAIRNVAVSPTSTVPLDLPQPHRAEALSDPKETLRAALERACGLSGRRLKKFKRDFEAHRAQLFAMLDREGPVRQLEAWQALEQATERAMKRVIDEQAAR